MKKTIISLLAVSLMLLNLSAYAKDEAKIVESATGTEEKSEITAEINGAQETETDDEKIDEEKVEKEEMTEKDNGVKVKTEDKDEKTDTSEKEISEEKSKNAEAIKRFREIKQLIKDKKIEAHASVKEIKALFKDADKTGRKEILLEIAAIKQAQKDFTIDTFVKGVGIDYEKYDNVKPIIENDRTLAPIRAVTEALGAQVIWDEETQGITITKDDVSVKMTIGSVVAFINDAKTTLDVAPITKNNRTLVPMRFIAEAFHLNIEWDEESKTIVVE